jgi:nitroimidazol reductase NimA-like FMN-containing flavoprotein (pyridoxamine 5'-phosphate oxidase superfamily)
MEKRFLATSSAWSESGVNDFLSEYTAPLRLAVLDGSGFPRVCSLWFRYAEGRLFCATKGKSKVVDWIRENPKCGFEVAPNEPPYYGVRGRGHATVTSVGAVELLTTLVDRYLGDRETEFSRGLLSRVEDEVAIEIEIDWMTSWDYRSRMSE